MKRVLSISLLLVLLCTVALSQVYWRLAEFRRVPNLTAYAAGDVVGPDTVSGASNLLAFPGIVPSGTYGGSLAAIKLTVDTSAYAKGRFRIYFYGDSVGNNRPLDNAPFLRTMKEDSLIFGYVDLDSLETKGTGGTTTSSVYRTLGTPIPIRTVAGSRTMYARIVALDAWTPPRAQRIRLELYAKP